MKSDPKVSIIIPTFNASKYLKQCLTSISDQTYSPIEVIIIDQSSDDITQEIVAQFKMKLIVREKPKFYSPPSPSRNIGAAQAKGEILYHLDSDMELPKKFIENMVAHLNNNPDIGALVVHEQDKTHGFWSRCKALERRSYWGNMNIESARIVRKDVFEQVSGYDDSINSGEDFDIHRKYQEITKIGFAPGFVYHNLGSLSYAKLLSKKFNYGKTASQYFQKHNTSGQSLLLEQFKCFISNYQLFLKKPIIGFGAIFLKLSEFTAGGAGLLYAKYSR